MMRLASLLLLARLAGPHDTCTVVVNVQPGSSPVKNINLFLDNRLIAQSANTNELRYVIRLQEWTLGNHFVGATAIDYGGLVGISQAQFKITKIKSERFCQ